MLDFIEYLALFGAGFVAGYVMGVIWVVFAARWPN